MKIHSFKTYQSVSFRGKETNGFNEKSCESIELIQEAGVAVMVVGHTGDYVRIPIVNVQWYKTFPEPLKKVSSAK
tara:strand:+ start:595 stop:819 length:225 start_codon:yes stop_codon:yes gene_type:complete